MFILLCICFNDLPLLMFRDALRYLSFTGAYPDSARPRITPNKLPHNVALRELARGLAEAHEAYGKSK